MLKKFTVWLILRLCFSRGDRFVQTKQEASVTDAIRSQALALHPDNTHTG